MSDAQTATLLLLTFNEPMVGSVVNIDGERFEIVRVLRWTGTLARLEIRGV